MLIPSKNKNEKIVLGLMSYLSDDLTISETRALLEKYRENNDSEIYLYYDQGTDNYIGLLVVTHNHAEDGEDSQRKNITIDKVVLIPSFRSEGIGYQMYQELCQKYQGIPILGTLDTVDIVSHWMQQDD